MRRRSAEGGARAKNCNLSTFSLDRVEASESSTEADLPWPHRLLGTCRRSPVDNLFADVGHVSRRDGSQVVRQFAGLRRASIISH